MSRGRFWTPTGQHRSHRPNRTCEKSGDICRPGLTSPSLKTVIAWLAMPRNGSIGRQIHGEEKRGPKTGFHYIYVVAPKEGANLGPKNVDPSYVRTCPKSPQNHVSRVMTSPNAFLDRTGPEVSGWVGVDFGPPPANIGLTGQTVPARSPVLFVAPG